MATPPWPASDAVAVAPCADGLNPGQMVGGLLFRRPGHPEDGAAVAQAGAEENAVVVWLPAPLRETSVFDLGEEPRVRVLSQRARHLLAAPRSLGPVVTFYAYTAAGARFVTARTAGSLLLEDRPHLPLLTLVRRCLGLQEGQGLRIGEETAAAAFPPALRPFAAAEAAGQAALTLAFELVSSDVATYVQVPPGVCFLRPLYATGSDGTRPLVLAADGSAQLLTGLSGSTAALRPAAELAAVVAEQQLAAEGANADFARATLRHAPRADDGQFASAGSFLLVLDEAYCVCEYHLFVVEPRDLVAVQGMHFDDRLIDRLRLAVRQHAGALEDTAVQAMMQMSRREWRRFGAAAMQLAPLMRSPVPAAAVSPAADNLPVVIVLVGMPGAGKSFFTAELTRRAHPAPLVRISQDVLGSAQRCVAETVAALALGQSVLIDRTNADPEQRGRWIALAHGARVFAVFLDTPLWLCKNRVLRRPDHETLPATAESLAVVDRFHQTFVPPVPEEGFVDVLRAEPSTLAAVLDRLARELPVAPCPLVVSKDVQASLTARGKRKKLPQDSASPAGPSAAQADPSAGDSRFLRRNAASADCGGLFFYVQSLAYLGAAGPPIDRIALELPVPPPWADSLQRRRPGPKHLTMVSPDEFPALLAQIQQRGRLETPAEAADELLRECAPVALDWSVRGIGQQSGLSPAGLPTTVLFAVVEWPAGQQLRASWGLGPAHFHVTLGFTLCDLHNVRKDASTLADPAPLIAFYAALANARAACVARARPCKRVRDALGAEGDDGLDPELRATMQQMDQPDDESVARAILARLEALPWESPAGRAAVAWLELLASDEALRLLQGLDGPLAMRAARRTEELFMRARGRAAAENLEWLPLLQGAVALVPWGKEIQSLGGVLALWYAGAEHVVLAQPATDPKAAKFQALCGAGPPTLPVACVDPPPAGPLGDAAALARFLASATALLRAGRLVAVVGSPRSLTVLSAALLLRLHAGLEQVVRLSLALPLANLASLSADDVAWLLANVAA